MRISPAAVSILASALCATALPYSQDCRCLPSDDCWPPTSTWSALNDTVEGRLVKTVPIGSPCHDPNYDAETCAALREQWTDPRLQYILPVATDPQSGRI